MDKAGRDDSLERAARAGRPADQPAGWCRSFVRHKRVVSGSKIRLRWVLTWPSSGQLVSTNLHNKTHFPGYDPLLAGLFPTASGQQLVDHLHLGGDAELALGDGYLARISPPDSFCRYRHRGREIAPFDHVNHRS